MRARSREVADFRTRSKSAAEAGRKVMARKPATRAEFDLFDVFYTDGTRRSNRRVPRSSPRARRAPSLRNVFWRPQPQASAIRITYAPTHCGSSIEWLDR